MDLSVRSNLQNTADAGLQWYVSCNASVSETLNTNTMKYTLSVTWSAKLYAQGYPDGWGFNGTSRPHAGTLYLNDGITWWTLGELPLNYGSCDGDTIASGTRNNIEWDRPTGQIGNCYLYVREGTGSDPNGASPPFFWTDTDGQSNGHLKYLHKVHFCETNSNTEVVSSRYKVEGSHLYVPSYETDQNYFGGWKSNSALGNNPASTIYSKTSANGSGTEYTYDRNGGDIYLHWVAGNAKGSNVKLDSNTYRTGEETWFPYDIRFIDSYNESTNNLSLKSTNPYESGTQLATINQAEERVQLRGAPYYDKENEDGIVFLGYFKNPTFTDNVKAYELTEQEWIYKSHRNYVTKAVPDNEYFNTTTQEVDLNASGATKNIYTKNGTIVTTNGYAVPVAGAQVTSKINLPTWKKAGTNETLYALWTKPNLKFYFDPDNGKPNEIVCVEIGTPGFNTNTEVQNYVFKSSQTLFNEHNINVTPQIGKYLHGDWETDSTIGTRVSSWYKVNTNEGYNLNFGGYIKDTTFYAKWIPFHHTIKASLDGQTYTAAVQGGEQYSATDFSSLVANFENNKPEGAVGFYGLYTKERIGGTRVINKDGSPNNNGIHFIDNKWAYRTEGEPEADLILYPHWVPDTNAKMNISSDPNNPQWRYGFIYINKNANNPNLAPDWEQVPEVTFIKN